MIAFAERSRAEGLIEVYTTESLRAGNYHNVLAIGSRRSAYGLDRDVLAALCLEGIGPSAMPGLLAADGPACGCLALLKTGENAGCLVEADVAHLWNIRGGHRPRTRCQTSGLRTCSSGRWLRRCRGGWPDLAPNSARRRTVRGLGRAMRALERLARRNRQRMADRWAVACVERHLPDLSRYRGHRCLRSASDAP